MVELPLMCTVDSYYPGGASASLVHEPIVFAFPTDVVLNICLSWNR